jgi:hypothetical protein
MRKYKAALFSSDGDWVTDYRDCSTIEEVWEHLVNQGSRWFFYPFHVVIVDHGGLTTHSQRVVDAAEPFEHMKGLTLRTFGKMIHDTPDDVLISILGN